MEKAGTRKRTIIGFMIMLVLLGTAAFISVAAGSVSVNIFAPLSDNDSMIIFDIRMPRTLLAAVSGAALAVSGYLLQTFFRNPIAGPYVMGISSGAKMTMVLVMTFVVASGGSMTSVLKIIASFAGALLSTFLILILSFRVKSMSVLLVAGIMVGYICTAVTEFIVTFADDTSIISLHGWAQGGFSSAAFPGTYTAVILVLIGIAGVFLMSKPIGAYMQGEKYAESLGVNVRGLQLLMIIFSSFLSAVVTAYAGPVSFVGIAVPFLVKKLIKQSRPIILIPALILAGAAFTLFCDIVARLLFSPVELSLSTVTAFFGAPVVLFIMAGRKRGQRDE